MSCMILAAFMFLVSIPLGISLGYKLNDKSMMVVGNMSFLEILDQIVSGVFIPIAAFCIAISFGWFMYKAHNVREFFYFRYLSNKLREEGLAVEVLGLSIIGI